MEFNDHTGVMEDKDVAIGLEWLGQMQGDNNKFQTRLQSAQHNYICVTNDAEFFGKDFDINLYGKDIVASFFAQAKSLLDNRRAYDISIASHIIPWVKQLGRNCHLINDIPGARERAKRMLDEEKVHPDTALFELVIAGNYADKGYHVEFIPEQKGIAKTPDLKYFDNKDQAFYIECKRLQKGKYETDERGLHNKLINLTGALNILETFNIWLDVTYNSELKDIPDDYIYGHLKNFNNRYYAWDDFHGRGIVKAINLNKVHEDILKNGSVMFSTKFARLMKGAALRDEYYNIYARAKPDNRDPRFIEFVEQASLVTWRCINPTSFESRSKHVTSLLKTIDDQLLTYGPGIAHIAIDVDIQGDVADKRRQKNDEAISRFAPRSNLCRTMVHYMVPRIDEDSAWMVDETFDERLSYRPELNLTPQIAVFTDSQILDNDLPGWRQ